MRRALPGLLCLLAPLVLIGPALLPGVRLLPQLPVGFEPLAAEHPEAAAASWERANLVTSDRLFPILTDELAIRTELAAGRLPLWEPGFGMGTPLFAGTVVGPCYPPNWLRYLLPPDVAGGWLALLSLWLAGLGMWLFLERTGLALGAAAVGAIGYQVGGFGLVNLHYVMKVDAALWLPWALWAVEGIYTGARRGGLWLTVAIACALLAGFPQIGVFTLAAALAFAAWRAFELRAVDARLVRALGFAALGVGASAVHLLPMAEASQHAVRQPQSAESLWPQRQPLSSCYTIPAPLWFFGVAPDTTRVRELATDTQLAAPGYVNPLEWTIGGGFVLSLMAIFGAAIAFRRARFPLLLLALSLGFAQGWPVVRALYYLPGAGLGAPGRAVSVTWAALPWLAALAADHMLAARRPLGPGAMTLIALLLGEGSCNGRLHVVPRSLAEGQALFPDSAAIEAVRAAAGDGRVLRFDTSATGIDDVLSLARPNLLHAYGIADLTPYIVFTNARLVQLFEALDARTRYRSGISRIADPAHLGHPLLDLARVTCVLSKEPLEHPRLEETFAREGFHVYRRGGALPVARGVTHAVSVESDATAILMLAAGAVPLATTTLLAPADQRRAPDSAGDGEVRILRVERPSAGRLDVEVESTAPGYVVFTEAWMPGWRASVNGADAPLVRADHVARAVPVPIGKSLVRTRYEPRSLRLGALLTALSLVLALSWTARGARVP